MPDSGDPHLSEDLRGIQETAAAQGYWLLLLGAYVPFRIDGDTRSTLLPPMVMVNEYVPALA